MDVRKKSGIYSITNTVTGKLYIGSAVDIGNRWAVHQMTLRRGTNGCKKLQNTWSKYGEAAFVFEVVEFVSDKRQLITHEQFYLDLLQPAYNICKKAGSCLGVKATAETRKKMSEGRRGEKNPNYGKTGAQHPAFGKKYSKEMKAFWSSLRVGEKNPMHGVTPKHAKLKPDDVKLIRVLISLGLKNKEIAEHFGITSTNVSHIKHGHGYRGVGI